MRDLVSSERLTNTLGDSGSWWEGAPGLREQRSPGLAGMREAAGSGNWEGRMTWCGWDGEKPGQVLRAKTRRICSYPEREKKSLEGFKEEGGSVLLAFWQDQSGYYVENVYGPPRGWHSWELVWTWEGGDTSLEMVRNGMIGDMFRN